MRTTEHCIVAHVWSLYCRGSISASFWSWKLSFGYVVDTDEYYVSRGFLRRRRNLRRVPTTEASRRCSLVGFLREIRCSFWGPLLRGFATGICLLADQNLVTSRIGIGPDLSDSCLSFFFVSPFFEQVDGCTALFSEKIVQKTGTCTEFCRGSELFSGPEPHSAVQSVQRNWTTLNDRICSPHTHTRTHTVRFNRWKIFFPLGTFRSPVPNPHYIIL